MDWLILVVISAITASFTRIIQKTVLNDENNNPIAFSFIFGVITTIIVFIWALSEGLNAPNLLPLTPNLVAMSLFYSLAAMLLYKSFQITEVSEASVLFASSTIWSVLSAIVFLKEPLTSPKILATILIFSGAALVCYSKSKWKLNKGHLFALLAAILFGLGLTNDAFLVSKFQNVSSYLFFDFLFPSLAILLLKPGLVKNIKYFIKRTTLIKLSVASLFYALSTAALFQAYKNGGEASVIFPIYQSNTLITVVIGYLILKERNYLLNKIIGALLVLSGIMLLK